MKFLMTFTIFTLPFCLLFSQSSEKLQFYEGKVSDLKEQAHNYGKMSLVYFYASWAMPCSWMESNTFSDTQLATYTNQHYFPIKVNIDNPQGKIDKENYRVTLIPSLLIFDSEGELVARYEEALSAEKLLEVLKKHYVPGQAVISASEAEEVTYASLSAPKPLNIYYPPLIPADAEAQYQQDTPESISYSEPAENPAISELAVATTPQEPQIFFSIQLGAYSSLTNAEERRKALAARLTQPLQIKKSVVNGRNIFRLLCGKYEAEEAAKAERYKLYRNGINGFVKKFDSL